MQTETLNPTRTFLVKTSEKQDIGNIRTDPQRTSLYKCVVLQLAKHSINLNALPIEELHTWSVGRFISKRKKKLLMHAELAIL